MRPAVLLPPGVEANAILNNLMEAVAWILPRNTSR